MPAANGEIYFEFMVQGRVVRVTAIDPKTGCEAVVMGPSGASRAALQAAALRKLDYVIKKSGGG
ncbi:MAG TPA: hypothetical protein VG387_00210 [Rhizomicrobium sp.]|jgi:hypothetical protein|nr:hypothetical protein [Rhizomicrobium sp.]